VSVLYSTHAPVKINRGANNPEPRCEEPPTWKKPRCEAIEPRCEDTEVRREKKKCLGRTEGLARFPPDMTLKRNRGAKTADVEETKIRSNRAEVRRHRGAKRKNT